MALISILLCGVSRLEYEQKAHSPRALQVFQRLFIQCVRSCKMDAISKINQILHKSFCDWNTSGKVTLTQSVWSLSTGCRVHTAHACYHSLYWSHDQACTDMIDSWGLNNICLWFYQIKKKSIKNWTWIFVFMWGTDFTFSALWEARLSWPHHPCRDQPEQRWFESPGQWSWIV